MGKGILIMSLNEKLKIAVYKKIDYDDNVEGLFLSEEYVYASDRSTKSAFDNWYADDITIYDFNRRYGENNWAVDPTDVGGSLDDDTQILYVGGIPRTVVKLVHMYGKHVLE